GHFRHYENAIDDDQQKNHENRGHVTKIAAGTDMKKLILTVLALGSLSIPLSCARNPVTGKRQMVLVSESEEIALGQQSDRQVRQEYGVVENQSLQSYVQAMGRKLAAVSHRPNLDWH